MTIKGKTDKDPGVWESEAVDLAVMDWFLFMTNSLQRTENPAVFLNVRINLLLL